MNERYSDCVEAGEHHGKMEALQKQRDEARAILAAWWSNATFHDDPVSPGGRATK
jgi:hypothetical protein